MKYSFLIVLLLLFFSCNKKTSSTNVSSKAEENQQGIAVPNWKEFNLLLKKEEIESLPFSMGEWLFEEINPDENDGLESYLKTHSKLEKQSVAAEKLNRFFYNLEFVDTLTSYFPINDFKPVSVQNLFFYKRLQPINKNLECLLYQCKVKYGGQSYLLVLITYDKIQKKRIDQKVVSIIGYGEDNWEFYTGLRIDENYSVKTVGHILEEDFQVLVERILKIQENGEIETTNFRKYNN